MFQYNSTNLHPFFEQLSSCFQKRYRFLKYGFNISTDPFILRVLYYIVYRFYTKN